MSDSERESYEPSKYIKNVLKELECPVCHDYLNKNITQCITGHSICGECKNRVKECPICKSPFANVRNYTLENVIASFQIPCKFADDGCTEELHIPDWKDHVEDCEYKDFSCPMEEEWWCTWTGKLNMLRNHINKKHNKVQHIKTRLSDADENFSYYYFVSLSWCHERAFKVFEIHKISDVSHEAIFVVQYIGDRKKAKDYVFKIDFVDQTDSGYELNVSASCIAMTKVPWKNPEYYFKIDNSCLEHFKTEAGSYKYNLTVLDRKELDRRSKTALKFKERLVRDSHC